MPIPPPAVDRRRYDDLLAEAIARIPVHNPEWTNFNRSDPGITLVELFAFLTESLLYRADQIPERSRRAFLSLLGVPLRPAAPARGLVTFANGRGPLSTVTLNHDLEVRAGQVSFRTDLGVDVLPVESRVYYKRPVALTADLLDQYRQLYASFLIKGQPADPPADLTPYQTTLLDGSDAAGVDLVAGTVDGAVWVALLARDGEDPQQTRTAIAGRTLALGVVPVVTDVAVTLPPGNAATASTDSHLEYAVPSGGPLPTDPARRIATYQVLEGLDDANVLLHPGIVQIGLPAADGLATWTDLDPIEEGAAGFPPSIDDPRLAARLVTWLRVRAQGSGQARFLWAGINATTVSQRARVLGEVLPNGTGQPDQLVRLAQASVLSGSVSLSIGAPPATPVTVWQEVSDLLTAGPEVPVPDPALPPGAAQAPPAPADVYALDAEAGLIRFGDGLRGRRPPKDAVMRTDYDYTQGAAGNVGPSTINSGPALPAGFTVANPVRTWGGADAETLADGERQVARYLQHRERVVSAADFDTVVRRTPGVELARVDVLPAYDPQLSPNVPGGAPGAVTLMLVPRTDPDTPDAPSPDRFVLDAVCAYLDPRRLVTTEVFLRGPEYLPVWISVGVEVLPGLSVAEVQGRIRSELRRVLSPLPLAYQPAAADLPGYPHAATGWPLRTNVTVAELSAYVTRVDGVRVVNGLLLATGSQAATAEIAMSGLQLPRVVGISVTPGDPAPLRGGVPAPGPSGAIPVPVLPEGC